MKTASTTSIIAEWAFNTSIQLPSHTTEYAVPPTTGLVELSCKETDFFDAVHGHLVNGRPVEGKDSDARALFERSELPQNFWGFGLIIYQPGRPRLMVVRASADPAFENIRNVIQRALSHPRFGDFDLADREQCRMQIDFIVDEPAAVEFGSLSETTLDASRFEYGVDGMRIIGSEQRRYILPGDAFVSSILGLGQLRQRVERLFPDTPIDQLAFYRFRSASYLSTR